MATICSLEEGWTINAPKVCTICLPFACSQLDRWFSDQALPILGVLLSTVFGAIIGELWRNVWRSVCSLKWAKTRLSINPLLIPYSCGRQTQRPFVACTKPLYLCRSVARSCRSFGFLSSWFRSSSAPSFCLPLGLPRVRFHLAVH